MIQGMKNQIKTTEKLIANYVNLVLKA